MKRRYNGPLHYNQAQRCAYMAVLDANPDVWGSHGWMGPGWEGVCWAMVAILCMSRPGEWAYVEK